MADNRAGLYIMMMITMLASCRACDISKKILEKVNVLEKKVSATIDIEQNVLGGKAPEKFYIINGDTAYIKIDGKLIGEYFSKIKNRRTEVR